MFPDLNQIDNLLQEFDDMIVPYMAAENIFALIDASALLWRLNVSNVIMSHRVILMIAFPWVQTIYNYIYYVLYIFACVTCAYTLYI